MNASASPVAGACSARSKLSMIGSSSSATSVAAYSRQLAPFAIDPLAVVVESAAVRRRRS